MFTEEFQLDTLGPSFFLFFYHGKSNIKNKLLEKKLCNGGEERRRSYKTLCTVHVSLDHNTRSSFCFWVCFTELFVWKGFPDICLLYTLREMWTLILIVQHRAHLWLLSKVWASLSDHIYMSRELHGTLLPHSSILQYVFRSEKLPERKPWEWEHCLILQGWDFWVLGWPRNSYRSKVENWEHCQTKTLLRNRIFNN